jgi:hypothetical protein
MKTYSYEITFVSGRTVIVEARNVQQAIILAQAGQIKSNNAYTVTDASELGSINYVGSHSQR